MIPIPHKPQSKIECVEDLVGTTMLKVWQSGDDEIHFLTNTGREFLLYHQQD